MKIRQTVLTIVTACPLLVVACFAAEPVDPPGFDAPSYTVDGSLRRPSGFRNWVFVGASLGLSYSPSKGEYGKQFFHNVYLDRRSYQGYAETGAFPERSMLAMAVYRQANKDELNTSLQGSFEGEFVALEVAVKDSERFADGWAYFDFSGGSSQRETAQPLARDKCFDCHAEHAADDNVFVQYYPVLRRHFQNHSNAAEK